MKLGFYARVLERCLEESISISIADGSVELRSRGSVLMVVFVSASALQVVMSKLKKNENNNKIDGVYAAPSDIKVQELSILKFQMENQHRLQSREWDVMKTMFDKTGQLASLIEPREFEAELESVLAIKRDKDPEKEYKQYFANMIKLSEEMTKNRQLFDREKAHYEAFKHYCLDPKKPLNQDTFKDFEKTLLLDEKQLESCRKEEAKVLEALKKIGLSGSASDYLDPAKLGLLRNNYKLSQEFETKQLEREKAQMKFDGLTAAKATLKVILESPQKDKESRIASYYEELKTNLECTEAHFKQSQKEYNDYCSEQHKKQDADYKLTSQSQDIQSKLLASKPLAKDEQEIVRAVIKRIETKHNDDFKGQMQRYDHAIKLATAGELEKLTLPRTAPHSRWPEGFSVAACTSQSQPSWGTIDCDVYTDSVLKNLKTSKTLMEAIHQTEKKGARISELHKPEPDGSRLTFEVPVSTDVKNRVWDKSESKKRHVLIVIGADQPPEKEVIKDKFYEQFPARLKKEFGDNIVFKVVSRGGRKELEQAFDALAKEAKPGEDVLIYFSGHGNSDGLEPGVSRQDELKEGAKIGRFWLSGEGREKLILTETEVKTQMQKLKHLKGILLISACYSGAWISKAPETHFGKENTNG